MKVPAFASVADDAGPRVDQGLSAAFAQTRLVHQLCPTAAAVATATAATATATAAADEDVRLSGRRRVKNQRTGRATGGGDRRRRQLRMAADGGARQRGFSRSATWPSSERSVCCRPLDRRATAAIECVAVGVAVDSAGATWAASLAAHLSRGFLGRLKQQAL